MYKLFKILGLFVIFISLNGFKPAKDFNLQNYCKEFLLNCDKKNTFLTIKTSKGLLKAELFGSTNPLTVANFISNIEKGIYDKRNFYKIINFPNNKILHFGIYPDRKKSLYENEFKLLNNIPLEIKLNNQKEPIFNYQVLKPLNMRNLENRFQKGSIAMVKTAQNSSSATEFFFTLNKSPELDGRYSVFGKIIEGYEILEKIDVNDRILKIEIDY